MAKETLENVFERYINVKYDKNLLTEIKTFRINWAQKSDDYIDFLGNNLTGVHTIRFSVKDDTEFLNILGITSDDVENFEYDLHKVKGVDKNMKVASNVIYLTISYLMHKFILSKDLKDNIKDEALEELYYVFAYKVISSILAHYFKYNTDLATARATVERLTNKFLIKRFNSWQAVFEHRSKDIKLKGIHVRRLKNYTPNDVIAVISDLQGKIRDMIKNIYGVFIEVVKMNEKIKTTSLITDIEDDSAFSSNVNRLDKYVNYINGIFHVPNDFIIDDLVHLTCSQLKYVDPDELKSLLHHISADMHIPNIDWILECIITSAIEYLNIRNINSNYIKNCYEVLVTLKSLFASANIKMKDITKIKKILGEKIKESNPYVPNKVINNLAIGFMIYVSVRSLYIKK